MFGIVSPSDPTIASWLALLLEQVLNSGYGSLSLILAVPHSTRVEHEERHSALLV